MLSVLCLEQLVTWTSVTQTHSATIIHILHTKVHTRVGSAQTISGPPSFQDMPNHKINVEMQMMMMIGFSEKKKSNCGAMNHSTNFGL